MLRKCSRLSVRENLFLYLEDIDKISKANISALQELTHVEQ